HHDPVDMSDLVVAIVDGLERPDSRRDVAVDMQPQPVSFGDRRRQPYRVEGAIELHPGEAILFRLAHQRDRFLLAGGHIGYLGRIWSFAIYQRGRVDMREE